MREQGVLQASRPQLLTSFSFATVRVYFLIAPGASHTDARRYLWYGAAYNRFYDLNGSLVAV